MLRNLRNGIASIEQIIKSRLQPDSRQISVGRNSCAAFE